MVHHRYEKGHPLNIIFSHGHPAPYFYHLQALHNPPHSTHREGCKRLKCFTDATLVTSYYQNCRKTKMCKNANTLQNTSLRNKKKLNIHVEFLWSQKITLLSFFFITCIACLLITVRRYSSKCSYFYIITPTSFAYADSSRETGIIHEIAAGRREPGDRREEKRKERTNKIK